MFINKKFSAKLQNFLLICNKKLIFASSIQPKFRIIIEKPDFYPVKKTEQAQ